MPVKVSIEFESAMADVKKVVNFDTPQQFKEMERDILKMTRTIPMAGKDIAAIVAAGGQSGVSRENLTGFAEKAAKMGVAFDMAAGQAGESMATLSNVLQIPIPKIGTLGDAINHLSDNANSKAADIVNVLTRVGSDIKQLGMTENQGAAWGSTFLSMGKAPELAAQAMKGMITSMSVMKAGGAKKELAALGLTTKEFAAAMDKDANRAMLNLLDRVKQLPKAEQFPMLLKMFGQNYADDAMMLANNVGEYNRQLALLEERDASGNLKYLGSMQREFANRSATTANQIQIFKNGISELGIRLGSIVLPAVNDFLSKCIKLTSMISDWAEKHPVLTKGIVGTAASLLAFKVGMFGAMVIANRSHAAYLALKSGLLSLKATVVLTKTVMQGGLGLSAISGTLGTVMRGFAAARTVIAGFGLSSLAVLWPVVLAVAAVAAVAFVIYKYWKPLKAFFAGFWEGLTKGLEPLTPLFDAFVGTLSGIWTAVQPYLQPVLDWFGDFFNLTQAGEGNARSWGESVGSALASVVNTVVSVGTMIVDGWRMIFDGIFSLADSAWTQIKTAFDGGLLGILGLILNWSPIGAFYSAFAAVLSWFGIDLPARFTEFGSNIIQGLWNGLQAKFEAVRAWLAEKAAALKNTFAGVMDIHSPSRVFRRFGGWMMEGLQIGINQGAPRPLNAIGGVASDLQQRFTNHTSSLAASMAANSAELSAARQGAAAAGGITVHFSPTIHAPGGNPQQIEAALQMGLQEFETMFRRMMDDKARRAY